MIEKVALASVSVIAAAACFALGIYVFRRNQHHLGSRAFFGVTMMATLAALFDLLTITSPDSATALLFARGIVLSSTLLGSGMLYLAFLLPFEREGSLVVRHRRALGIATLVFALAMAAGGIEVAEDRFGWWVFLNTSSLLWYVSIVLFFLAGTIVLILNYKRERSGNERRRMLPMIAGMAVPVFSALMVVELVLSETTDPSMLSAIVLASCLCIGYGVVQQKLFVMEPVGEDVKGGPRTPSVKPGSSVLVETKGNDLTYRMFVNEIAAGGQGLIISRKHPSQLRERYGLLSTPMLWLTTKPGASHVDPSSLSLLLHSIMTFLQKSDRAVILLDGLEYLEAYNSEEAIMQFIYGLRDAITVTGSKLIIMVDPVALGPLVLPRLEREMDIIDN
jgi:hypothetical protein